MYLEDEYLMLSALQHLLFCERQCFLIHAEQQWEENRFTVAGDIMHEKVDRKSVECIGQDIRIERGVMIKSVVLGISGRADVVEFHRDEKGIWWPFPVEYKRGKPKSNDCDKVQLCAQAICLEEMLDIRVERGALFYGSSKRRMVIEFSTGLRNVTRMACERLHDLIPFGTLPDAISDTQKCGACSLKGICLPKTSTLNSVGDYLESILEEL